MISKSSVTLSFGNIPSKRVNAVGGLLGSTPIICGGFHGSVWYDSCITLIQSRWRETHTMATNKRASSSIQLNATTLWIIGGENGIGVLDSTDFVGVGLDSAVGNPGPNLPYAMSASCSVKYSEDKVYVLGGHDGSSRFNKVLIFNPMNGFTHIEGPSMITKRSGHLCGLMSNGQQSKIVVAGGYNNGGYLSAVEIFDPTTNNWISGKEIHFLKKEIE